MVKILKNQRASDIQPGDSIDILGLKNVSIDQHNNILIEDAYYISPELYDSITIYRESRADTLRREIEERRQELNSLEDEENPFSDFMEEDFSDEDEIEDFSNEDEIEAIEEGTLADLPTFILDILKELTKEIPDGDEPRVFTLKL